MTKPTPPDLRKMLELWADSSLKVQVIVFFHNNPGMIETLEGLAKRLGTSIDALRREVQGHVSLGVLKEEKTASSTLLIYDRAREGEVQTYIQAEIRRLSGEAA